MDGECLVGQGARRGHSNDGNAPIKRLDPRKYTHVRVAISRDRSLQSPSEIIRMMTPRFEARKQKILEQLGAPDGEYHDLSPKGSVDAPIRDLIREINALDGIVTTSSCSGRISVFLEGRKADVGSLKPAEEDEESRAGPGGKGGGGTWLFISHDPVEVPEAPFPDFTSKFGLEKAVSGATSGLDIQRRFIHLKFEPMVSARNASTNGI